MEFVNSKVGTLKVNMNLNKDGYIAQTMDTPAGVKTVTFKGFKASGNLEDANKVFTMILQGIGMASYNSYSATKTIIEGVI